jgi:ribosomal protein S27AE
MEVVVAPHAFQGSVMRGNPDGPILTGLGNNSLQCGACGHVLVEGITAKEVADAIFECGRCHAFNKPRIAR